MKCIRSVVLGTEKRPRHGKAIHVSTPATRTSARANIVSRAGPSWLFFEVPDAKRSCLNETHMSCSVRPHNYHVPTMAKTLFPPRITSAEPMNRLAQVNGHENPQHPTCRTSASVLVIPPHRLSVEPGPILYHHHQITCRCMCMCMTVPLPMFNC